MTSSEYFMKYNARGLILKDERALVRSVVYAITPGLQRKNSDLWDQILLKAYKAVVRYNQRGLRT
jgi:hypothetical protein